jgi:hypothetical protein
MSVRIDKHIEILEAETIGLSKKFVYELNPEGFGCHRGMVLAAIQSVKKDQ